MKYAAIVMVLVGAAMILVSLGGWLRHNRRREIRIGAVSERWLADRHDESE